MYKAALALCALLLLVGCSSPASPYRIAVATPEIRDGGSVQVGSSTDIYLYVRHPTKGGVIDQWTHNINSTDVPHYWSVKAGDHMGITLRNKYQDATRVRLAYITPEYEYQGYFPAPACVEGWVDISERNFMLPPNEVWCIPISITMGDVRTVPDKFWFGIEVRPERNKQVTSGITMITQAVIWWLVSIEEE